MSWQAPHFRKVKYRFRGRRGFFARSSIDFVAGAALSQGQVQNPLQARPFRKVKYRFRGRFKRSAPAAGPLFFLSAAGALLWLVLAVDKRPGTARAAKLL